LIAEKSGKGIMVPIEQLSEIPKTVNQFPGGRPTDPTLGHPAIKEIKSSCIKVAAATIEEKTLMSVLIICPFAYLLDDY